MKHHPCRNYYTPFSVRPYLGLFGLFFLLLTACEKSTPEVADSPQPTTPREVYWATLDSTGLAQTQMGKAWQAAGMAAMADSVDLTLPFKEIGYFSAAEPTAFGYRLSLKAGELLQIQLDGTPDSTLFFVDFFEVIPTDSTTQFQHLLNAENYQTDSLTYEAALEGTFLLRIQPELLASGRFTLQLLVQPTYGSFPVHGKDNRAIWSVWGDPRGGGSRKHEGIDVFAKRGTPAIAATNGVVRRVREKGLGGKQVWLFDEERNQSLYYAHLDSQLVEEGQWVQAGDTLGTVGNTGNAKTTRPHLHFGIYRRGFGAIDPEPFVSIKPERAPRVASDTSWLGKMARVRSKSRLRAAPGPRAEEVALLERHLPLQITGASKYWYRVRLQDGFSGYLPVSQVEGISRSIAKLEIPETTELLQSPTAEAAPVKVLEANTTVEIIGQSDSHQLVRSEEGAIGWILSDDD